MVSKVDDIEVVTINGLREGSGKFSLMLFHKNGRKKFSIFVYVAVGKLKNDKTETRMEDIEF